jgi:tRNA pseudouridine38-40 synthase
MPRYSLLIEYDGAPFMGWQRQKHGPSVQQALEEALSHLDGRAVTVFGAGRTDAGVHARGQVAHVDMEKPFRPDKLRDGTNHHLGDHPIAVLDADEVEEDFHARFDARYRTYLYRLIDRRPPLALDRGRVWRIPQALDVEAMEEAAQHLIGEYDFTTFRDGQCQAKSPIKTLDAIAVRRVGEEVHVDVGARSFLHRQVRSIVGSLAEVGRGKRDADWMGEILAAQDRQTCGPVAPAHGLYLMEVHYPER